MPQVSQRPLKKEVWERIFNLFVHSVARITDNDELARFLLELLTPTERIMLAKRLAIALMLAKGNQYGVIKEKLHVTSSTISAVKKHLFDGSGGLQVALKKIINLQTREVLWEQLKDILDQPAPSYYLSDWGRRKYERNLRKQEIRESL
jgi:uncharacterized protein YerC